MKEILIVSDSPYLDTGFGRLGRELAEYLRGKYKIIHLGLYDPRTTDEKTFKDRYIPWTVYRAKSPYVSYNIYKNIIEKHNIYKIILISDIWAMHQFVSTGIYTIAYLHIENEPFPEKVYLNHRWVNNVDILKNVDHIVASGSSVAEIIQKCLLKHKIDKNIDIIPDGQNMLKFRPLRAKESLKRSIFKTDKFLLGYFGRQSPRKGLPYVIEAFAKWDNPNACLYLHSALEDPIGWNIPALIEHTGAKNVITNKNLTVQNGLPDEELNKLYNACDATILLSSGEGYGATACVARNTLVATPIGHRRIQLLKPGDTVYSTHNKKIVENKIIKISRYIKYQKCVILRTNYSFKDTIVTLNHNLFFNFRYRAAKSLKRGMTCKLYTLPDNGLLEKIYNHTVDNKQLNDAFIANAITAAITNKIKYKYKNHYLRIFKDKPVKYENIKIIDVKIKVLKMAWYNLELENDHNYIIDGHIISHNCQSLAAGTPIILTEISELKNYTRGVIKVPIKNYYIEPNTNFYRGIPNIDSAVEAMRKIYDDSFREKLATEARTGVLKYDWANIGPLWEKIL